MENNDSRSDQPSSPDSPQQTTKPEAEREPVRLKIWQLEWSGPLPPLLALIFGLVIGMVLFYSMFEFQKPEQLYNFLMATPKAEAISAWQTQYTPPLQTVEVTKEVTREVTREITIRETEIVPSIVKETVVVTKIVEITPTPSPFPRTYEVLSSDLRNAFVSAGEVIRNLGGNDYRGWSSENVQRLMASQLDDIWAFYAEKRLLNEIEVILRQFTQVDIVEWEAGIPEDLERYQRETTGEEIIFDITDLTTYLHISGVYICPGTNDEISISGDDKSFEFVSNTVVLFDQHIIKQWIPEVSIRNQLIEYCQPSN